MIKMRISWGYWAAASVLVIGVLAALTAARLRGSADGTSGPLHDRAVQAGGKLILYYQASHGANYPNLEELANRSDLIVLGHTLMNRGRLQNNGAFITQNFWISVQMVFKGQLPKQSRIAVAIPGGVYRFADRSWIFVDPTESRMPKNGRSYVFFLQNDSAGARYKAHELVGGYQGLYDVTGGLVTAADGIPDDPCVMLYRNMGSIDFLRRIKAAAAGH